jgi:predicted small metal-binding protein
MPYFRCRDIDMSCGFEATAKTEDELTKKIAEHAREAHNMKTIPPDVMKKVKKAIKR